MTYFDLEESVKDLGVGKGMENDAWKNTKSGQLRRWKEEDGPVGKGKAASIFKETQAVEYWSTDCDSHLSYFAVNRSDLASWVTTILISWKVGLSILNLGQSQVNWEG